MSGLISGFHKVQCLPPIPQELGTLIGSLLTSGANNETYHNSAAK